MGGTNFNGLALVHELVRQGHEVTVLNRGRSTAEIPDSVSRLVADRSQPETVRAVLAGTEWDVIADITAYHPHDVELMIELFAGHLGHYIFASSTVTYAQTDVLPITETHPDDRSDRQRFMMKFLFARTAEPLSPSWLNQGTGWPGDGSPLPLDPPGAPDRKMYEHVWDWHCGRTANGAGNGQCAADSAERVPELLAELGDGCESARLRAAYALKGAGSAAVPGLTRLLRDDSQEPRRNACHALSAIGEAAVEPLIDSLQRGDAAAHERAEAAEILGDIGLAARPAVPALTRRLQDESVEVRAQAAEALGTVAQSEPAAAQALATALGDEDDRVRRNAAFALVRLGSHAEPAVPALRDVLYDRDRYVRGDAAQALLRIGTGQAWEAVLPFLETSRWCPLTTKESAY